jgi:hypothetical protein
VDAEVELSFRAGDIILVCKFFLINFLKKMRIFEHFLAFIIAFLRIFGGFFEFSPNVDAFIAFRAREFILCSL